jgi:hypothetical protein
LFSCISIFAPKNEVAKIALFAKCEIAKGGAKLLTFVKIARNADLEIAEK